MKTSGYTVLCVLVAACGTSGGSSESDVASPVDTAALTDTGAADADSAVDTGGEPDTAGQGDTAGEGDTGAGDAAGLDAADPDTADPDTADPDTADPDTADPDTAAPDPAACGAATTAYLAAAAALNTCTTGADCQWITHPVCGTGCFVPVNSTADHTDLEAAWQSFSSAGCVPDPVIPECCDIAPPQFGFGCDAGKCTSCYYQCALDCECEKDAVGCDLPKCKTASCDTLVAAVDAEAAAHTACSIAADCTVFEDPICNTFGCYQRAIAKTANIETLSTLAKVAQDALCEPFHCGCAPVATPTCVNGACTLGVLVP